MFELLAPMRDKVMYHQDKLKADAALWAKYSKPFKDCGIKKADTIENNKTAYSTDNIYEKIKDPKGVDIHHNVLQWIEEASIDLVC